MSDESSIHRGKDAANELGTSTEKVAEEAVRQAKELVATFRAIPDDEWAELPERLKQILSKSPLGNACWNDMNADTKQDLLGMKPDVGDRILGAFMEGFANKVELAASKIHAHFDAILRHQPGEMLSTAKAYLQIKNPIPSNIDGDKFPHKDNRKSLGSLSNKKYSSKVSNKLNGNNIHYNMFTTGEFREQEFVRFNFPDMITSLEICCNDAETTELSKTLDEIQQFLGYVRPRAYEPVTQAMFSLFLEKVVEAFNGSMKSQNEESSSYVVTSVTGMEELKVDVMVSLSYREENMRKRQASNKSPKREIEGPMAAILNIASDLVVVPATIGFEEVLHSRQQQQQFIHCLVNVEMKRLRFLLGKSNTDPFTQLGAESLARKKALEGTSDHSKVLYSVLTDCRAFYFLCHVVKESQPDEYWISRQEQNPKRVVTILLWMLQHSHNEVVPKLKDWEMPTKDNDQPANDGEDERSPPGDTGGGDKESDEKRSNRPRNKRPKPSNDQEPMALTMADVFPDDDGSSEGEMDWDHFYAMQLQRQTGPKFHFSANFLRSS